MTIAEVQGMEGDTVTMQEIFRFEQVGIDESGKAHGRFMATGLRPKFLDRLKACGMELDMAIFERQVLTTDERE
jgi:pilus assembly protein CpaF